MTKEEAAQALKAWRESPPPRALAEFERLNTQLMATCGIGDVMSAQNDMATVEYFALFLAVMGPAPTTPAPSSD